MKNLYSALGIDPGASEQEVAAALENRPDLAAYSSILLNQERRAAYDRAHMTLRTIDGLRSRLGLDPDKWSLETSADQARAQRPDPTPPPTPPPTAPSPAANAGATARSAASQAAEPGNARSQPSAVRIRPVLVLALVAAIALAVAAFKLL
jgi:hypothetical protein